MTFKGYVARETALNLLPIGVIQRSFYCRAWGALDTFLFNCSIAARLMSKMRKKISSLREAGYTYVSFGALWLNNSVACTISYYLASYPWQLKANWLVLCEETIHSDDAKITYTPTNSSLKSFMLMTTHKKMQLVSVLPCNIRCPNITNVSPITPRLIINTQS